jgi:hypothetical protein
VGFVADKAALGQVFLRVLLFSPVSIISSSPHTHIPSGERTIGPLVAAVQRYILTLSSKGKMQVETVTYIQVFSEVQRDPGHFHFSRPVTVIKN